MDKQNKKSTDIKQTGNFYELPVDIKLHSLFFFSLSSPSFNISKNLPLQLMFLLLALLSPRGSRWRSPRLSPRGSLLWWLLLLLLWLLSRYSWLLRLSSLLVGVVVTLLSVELCPCLCVIRLPPLSCWLTCMD